MDWVKRRWGWGTEVEEGQNSCVLRLFLPIAVKLALLRNIFVAHPGRANQLRVRWISIGLAPNELLPHQSNWRARQKDDASPNRSTDSMPAATWAKKWQNTYNTEDSQVVTDPSTNSALCCLYMGERTGSLVFSRMWSYVEETAV